LEVTVDKATDKKKRKRSPNFPSFALAKSIANAEKLLKQYSRHEIPWKVAIEALGYTVKSSVGMQTMASLQYYGLINVKGKGNDRVVIVSDLAYRIIMDDLPDSPARERAKIEAALKPVVFKKVYDKFSDSMPDDSLIKNELLFTHDFNPDSTNNFIKAFKRTMDYAKVYESGIIGEENADEAEGGMVDVHDEQNSMPPHPSQPPKHRSVGMGTIQPGKGEMEIAKYPVGRGLSIRLIADGPITQKAIAKLSALLKINMDDFPEDIEADEPTDN
jgi:hypothetical protein